MAAFHTIPEIVEAARAALPRAVWDHSAGATETETTLRRNRYAFESIGFRPRVLTGVGRRDTSTTFLGHRLALPVLPAPVGPIVNFHAEGALAVARAADQASIAAFLATSSYPGMEAVRAATTCPLFLQLYIRGDHAWLEEIVRRAERAGVAAICPTVDTPAHSRLDRDIANGFRPLGGKPTPNTDGLPDVAADRREEIAAELCWDDITFLREVTRLPIILKGVLDPRDAELAVEHGVAAVYVSNHGGRALDHSPATIEVLPEIVQAVRGRAEILVDSGFLRGSDVVKALCLGATAVCIGKLMTWGLGAAGMDGVLAALELLREEIGDVMAYLGAKTVCDLGPQCVRPTTPPPAVMWPYTDEARTLAGNQLT